MFLTPVPGRNLGRVSDPAPSAEDANDRHLEPGTRVEVQNSFDEAWSKGFVVIEHTEAGYRLARRSDNQELPGVMAPSAVRRERKNSMWWI